MNHPVSTAVLLGEVLVAAEGIALVDQGRVVSRVPRSSITEVQLRRGFLSTQPIPQFGIGVLFSLVGLLSARAFVFWAFHRMGPLKAMGLLVILLPLGSWLSVDALKRGQYLVVESPKGSLRFPLRGSGEAVTRFVEHARTMGYHIVDKRT